MECIFMYSTCITLCDCPCCVVALPAKAPTSWTMSHCTMSNINLHQLATKETGIQKNMTTIRVCGQKDVKKNGCYILEMWPFIRGQPCKWRNEKVSMMTLDFGLSSLRRWGPNWAQFYFPKKVKSLFTRQAILQKSKPLNQPASSKIINPSIHHQEPTSNI